MNKNNIKLNCYNQYCVFNKNKQCCRSEISLNRIGVCENIFLVGSDNFKNLEDIKTDYLKNMLNPTNEIMKDDVDWFHKRQKMNEIHPLEVFLTELLKQVEKEDIKNKRTKK